ncbi:folylpolyglutamate synthase/dihydrofolate synthase family protein [Reyranella sp.]|uniref:bifunctional folylpolyglutamate synthase/dihydrofolate synthase n=1 Tax=Reyranella sp. TaxID=1929291 RepID=UPI000BCE0D23|nr:folylpolyglutamate synthase/dihydrofolate synthase family protein [Reyranella sp.]OYY34923.1 MAG: bifunctional folylpolyglutamate synthase/dihydrofolate synthase [Rhodospirillales bacterium 35-66-84]OYZ91347.1 MAG: bifunctional folylpolyglutamate synthase/dihydrofolate synthase [Rhodospirillales bacterium 24-66-33]OZB21406.1 MAG: bifunctional folylpolyglutamate synthase/dihydrofolate synthase [Rhodospirillales bacterium 39-66-50]HQS18212.1 folylpolyglutamate synthase/dihydrofolate synthase f
MTANDPIVQRLMSHHPRVITLGLERIERLLERLGSPERKLPPLIHVAGTNGKGSLVAYLRAIAEAAGYRVHVYTSPHLVHFNERIRIAGRLIDDHELDEMLTECEEANGDTPISFFDITTALAFLAFSRVPADLGIIEVGMGGRFDSTNVIAPALSAITPVGYDHTGFLGDKLEGIAWEKAGILKRATPGVIGRQRDVSAQVIETEAAKLAAPLFRMGREWQVMPKDSGFRYESDLLTLDLPNPALAGAHQIDNAATAVACIERLRAARFDIDDTAIRKGLGSVEWPARLQQLKTGPLPDSLPPGCELWLDGGHNEDCGIVLGRVAAEWAKEPAALPLYLVFAMQTTKDASGFLRPLARFARAARAVPFPEGHAAYPPQEACARAADVGLDCAPANDIGAALEDLMATQPAPMRILICGSLYLAGEVLVRNG